MAQAVRDATRRAERAERALREAQRNVAAVQRALLGSGPMMRLLRLYDDLDAAADPLRARQIEGGGAPHPFDRPMPHLSTRDARDLQGSVDRALFRICDVIADWLNTPEQAWRRDLCPACRGEVDRTGRPANRRKLAAGFLRQTLQAGRVREDHLRAAASQAGIGKDTLRRAADELYVHRYVEDNVAWWQLPGFIP